MVYSYSIQYACLDNYFEQRGNFTARILEFVSFKIAILRTKISSDKHVSLSFSLVMVFKKEEKIDGFFCFWLNSPHHLPVFWLTYLFNNFCHFWWFLKVLNLIDETLFVKGITDHPLRRRVNSACWTMIMLLMNVQQLK